MGAHRAQSETGIANQMPWLLHLPKRSCLGRSLADSTAGMEGVHVGHRPKGSMVCRKDIQGLELTCEVEQAAPHILQELDR